MTTLITAALAAGLGFWLGHWKGCGCGCRVGGSKAMEALRQELEGTRAGEGAQKAHAEEIELKYRRQLWLSHGHSGIYGDDGEMQCGECVKHGACDYKRDSLVLVENAYSAACILRGAKEVSLVDEWKKKSKSACEALAKLSSDHEKCRSFLQTAWDSRDSLSETMTAWRREVASMATKGKGMHDCRYCCPSLKKIKEYAERGTEPQKSSKKSTVPKFNDDGGGGIGRYR